jgi:hypothetical protein
MLLRYGCSYGLCAWINTWCRSQVCVQIELTFLVMLLYRWWSFCANYFYSTLIDNTICRLLKVNPILISNNFGKEVVTKWTTNLTSNKELCTNGYIFFKWVSNLISFVDLAFNWFYGWFFLQNLHLMVEH